MNISGHAIVRTTVSPPASHILLDAVAPGRKTHDAVDKDATSHARGVCQVCRPCRPQIAREEPVLPWLEELLARPRRVARRVREVLGVCQMDDAGLHALVRTSHTSTGPLRRY